MSDRTQLSWAKRRKIRVECRAMCRKMRRVQPLIYTVLLKVNAILRNPTELEPEDLAKWVEMQKHAVSALAAVTINVRSLRTFIGLKPRWHPSNLGKDLVPPIGACLLLDLLLGKADRSVIPGDMEEEFRTKLVDYSLGTARLWFWSETVQTIATRNAVSRWVLVYGLTRLMDWLFRGLG